jgi:hypothetical protein
LDFSVKSWNNPCSHVAFLIPSSCTEVCRFGSASHGHHATHLLRATTITMYIIWTTRVTA